MFLNSAIMICSQDTALQGIYIDPSSEDFFVQFFRVQQSFFLSSARADWNRFITHRSLAEPGDM